MMVMICMKIWAKILPVFGCPLLLGRAEGALSLASMAENQ